MKLKECRRCHLTYEFTAEHFIFRHDKLRNICLACHEAALTKRRNTQRNAIRRHFGVDHPEDWGRLNELAEEKIRLKADGLRRCSVCQVIKPFDCEHWYARRSNPSGLAGNICKMCSRSKSARRRRSGIR